jgi:hypothetical protein
VQLEKYFNAIEEALTNTNSDCTALKETLSAFLPPEMINSAEKFSGALRNI